MHGMHVSVGGRATCMSVLADLDLARICVELRNSELKGC
jgi:hypothetical protein